MCLGNANNMQEKVHTEKSSKIGLHSSRSMKNAGLRGSETVPGSDWNHALT